MDRLCIERRPGVWHNGGSPRQHVDASRDFFILYFLRTSSARGGGGVGGGGGRYQTFEHRPPPTFRYCLWIARGFYPNDIIPSLPEQTFIARTKTLIGLARALRESAFQFLIILECTPHPLKERYCQNACRRVAQSRQIISGRNPSSYNTALTRPSRHAGTQNRGQSTG